MSGRRRTGSLVDGHREAIALAATLGGEIRSERRRRRWRQADLATRVGISRSHLAGIERGRGVRIPLDVWIALGLALGRPLAVSLSRTLAAPQLADAGHLALQELAISLARRHGWRASFELPTRSSRPGGSVDVAVRDDVTRRLHLWECWNSLRDLGEAARSTDRKVAEAAALAASFGTPDDPRGPYSVHACWLVRPSAANHALLRRYPGILSSRFPGSSLTWARSIETGSPPPAEPGLVWCDPASGRIVPVRWRG
jgi:transcriptional regulator with XRE-family HTH domain